MAHIVFAHNRKGVARLVRTARAAGRPTVVETPYVALAAEAGR